MTTDEQIRELRDQSISLGLDDVETWCDVALGEHPPDAATVKLWCRARCAEILNARAVKAGDK